MKVMVYGALLVLTAPVFCFAQKKEIVELQRDIAQLQDQMRALQTSINEKTTALTVLVQQNLDMSNKNTAGMAVLERAVTDQLTKQQQGISTPVAVIGTKVDQLSGDVQGVKESVNDLNNRMNKMQAQLADIKLLLSNVPPPTAAPGGAPPPTGAAAVPPATAGSTTPPQGVSAENLYASALRDKNSGNLDQAQQEFNDYLRWFGNTDYAPNCQFYLGEIAYNKSDFEAAIKAFDSVLERYSENNKTADSMYMKGKALLKQNQRNAAVQEFREIIKRYPNKDVSTKAKSELKALGLTASAAAAPAPGRAGGKRRR